MLYATPRFAIGTGVMQYVITPHTRGKATSHTYTTNNKTRHVLQSGEATTITTTNNNHHHNCSNNNKLKNDNDNNNTLCNKNYLTTPTINNNTGQHLPNQENPLANAFNFNHNVAEKNPRATNHSGNTPATPRHSCRTRHDRPTNCENINVFEHGSSKGTQGQMS
jgi:hypothetical protein